MANARRGHALTDVALEGKPHRDSVERALQLLKKQATDLQASIDALQTTVDGLPAAVTDHGALTGLGDDDHTQYALAGAATASRLTQATARLLGRTTASSGAIEEISVGAGLSLAAGSLTNTVSAYTDEQAQDAVAAMWVDGHAIDSVYVDATPTFTVAVDETEFATGPGLITPAMLNNGSARSLLGVTGNSAAARADIAASGTASAPQVMSDNGTTVDWRSAASLFEAGTVLYEVDFSTLASNTFTTGTEVIDGLSWTVANEADLNRFDIQNGTGLRMTAGTSLGTHNTFTSATQDMPYLYLPLSSIPNWNGMSELVADIYYSSLTLEATNENVTVALWGVATDPHSTSVARVRRTGIINSAGTLVPYTLQQTTGPTNGSEARAGQNVLSIRFNNQGVLQIGWATWSSGWPTLQNVTMELTTVAANVDPFLRNSIRFVLGMGVINDASPTTACVIHSLRFRRAA